MSNMTVDLLEQMRAHGWIKRTVTPTHFQYRLGKMPYRSDMDTFMRLLHSVARTTNSYSAVQASPSGEFFYQVLKPKAKHPSLGTAGLAITGFDEKEVKAITAWLVRDFKSRWILKRPLEQIIVRPHKVAKRFHCEYDGAGRKITVKIGLKVKWPQSWMEESLNNWHDCYVMAFAWVLYCHFRQTAGQKTTSAECQEVCKAALHRYRVAHIDLNFVMEKADYGIIEAE